MSTDKEPFTIRLKIGNNEVEVSGDHDEVVSTLQNISELVTKVMAAFGSVPTQQIAPESELGEIPSPEEFPSIAIDPATPCPEAIVQLLSTDWGKKKPRTLGELLAAMKVNAIHYPEGTVKGRLTDLTKRGVLRRINGRNGYEYILIKP